jgi:pilus assembly protein Flp/PilA
MKKIIVGFLKDEEGLTMVEYAIAGALVSIAAVTAFTNLGAAVATRIGDLVTAVNGDESGSTCRLAFQRSVSPGGFMNNQSAF